MKSLKTNKLFFKKWPFKIVCKLSGSQFIVRLTRNQFYLWANDLGIYAADADTWRVRLHKNITNKAEVIRFKSIVDQFTDKGIQLRAKSGTFSIYCLDKKLFEQIKFAVAPWMTEEWSPDTDEELTFLTSNDKKNICNALPHGKFKYKVFINMKFESTNRAKFLEWAVKYPDDIKMSNSTIKWLDISRNSWIQAPFFYVTSDKILTMVHLYLGKNVQRVEEYILRDSINTP